MRRKTRAVIAVAVAGMAIGLAYSSGCGGDDDDDVAVRGNVTQVLGEVHPTASLPGRLRFFARIRDLFGMEAIAQEATCPARSVLVCITVVPEGEGKEPRTDCAGVNKDECEFSVDKRLPSRESSFSVFFVDDDDSGRPDPDEKTAALQNSLGTVCNGNVYVLNNVTIDFDSGQAQAGEVDQTKNGCGSGGEPTPTQGPPPEPTEPPACVEAGGDCTDSPQCCSEMCVFDRCAPG